MVMALHRFSMAYHRVHGHLTQKSIQNMFSPFSNMFGIPILIYSSKDKRLQGI